MSTHPTTPFTLERMRADVARVIGEPAEDIGLDDNLMDWGLDSMRLLSLVIDWNQAGLALDISELGQHTSLNGWWTLVQKRQGQA
ncbi:phosphopantetheine-binding protein [Hydrogenophaga sp. BPS33]|uniref:phosphopantetheine-binding protein n=1 Tax=Hydrogenophaga sp. BPS33 TaxID=2651974 RepID=UPI00131F7F3F|nr:phosphopantetheine-binding protein [Hydrogenophaga sp. BPS33]QHE87703.1 phosphopantetheine-binding protein [Hydrogenophaga sp. BPS33]